MIRPGDILDPDLFERIRRELDRRSRIWNGINIRSSNLNTGTLLRATAPGGGGTSQPVVVARIEQIQNLYPLVFDFIEVEYDDVRQDYVPKPGGRSTEVFGGNELGAYELNSIDALPNTVPPGVNPINQVAVLQNVMVDGEPSGFWWFDQRQIVALDRNIIVLDRGQGGDCGWVGAPDSDVTNSACSPVGYRYGSPYGQAPGLFTPFYIAGVGPNPCIPLGPLLGGCNTPNDGQHGDAVQYQTCCPDPLPETLSITVPSGEVSGTFPDTLTPGTYGLVFSLSTGTWQATIPNATQSGTPINFSGQSLTAIGDFLTGIVDLAFVSCNPPMLVFVWSGTAGPQHLTIML